MRIPFLLVLPLITFSGTSAFGEQIAPTFSQKLDIQVRYDDRSNRPSREQYRLRYYPSLAITSSWSVNSFVVTGDDFSSTIRQTAIFDPVGLLGLIYWYALYPLHQLVFAGMLRGIADKTLPLNKPAKDESTKK